MPREDDSIHLIDLASQAHAVQQLLRGRSEEDKLQWLGQRGELRPLSISPDRPQAFLFRSRVGFECVFFIHGDELVFVGDTTWGAKPPG